jgi:cobalt-zinc-cadmium efflux system membrane fusion protein
MPRSAVLAWGLPMLILALPSQVGCGRPAQEAPAEVFIHEGSRLRVPDQSPLRHTLQVAVAQEQVVQTGLAVPASIEADPAELVKILPPLSGRIIQLHVHLGDWVRKGQPLVTMESADLAQAYSDLQKALAQYQQAKRTVERVRELGRHDIASRREVDQAETDFASVESEWRRARAHILQLGADPEGRQASHLLTIRAPIAARVADLAAGTGGYWNDLNAPLLVLANLTHVWFTASVQEKDIAGVFMGQEVSAELASFPGETFRSKVAFVGEMLDPDTRTVKVRMVFDNAAHRLLPAMFATVTFKARPRKGILVPAAAVIQGQEGSKVFVEVAPWAFEAAAVKAGAQVGSQVEILEGLKAGQRFVAKEGVILND